MDKGGIKMKSIDRIDEQPTAVDQPLLRLRNVFQDRRSGKDLRWTEEKANAVKTAGVQQSGERKPQIGAPSRIEG
jgi:hypothetical protein